MKKQKRSLRNILFRAITIPAVAGLLILAGVIFLSLRIIYTGIVDRQNLVIESLAQQGNQYLAETGRLMGTIAEVVIVLPEENQLQLLAESRHNYPRFTAFYLLDETGRVMLEDTDTFSLLDLDLSGEQYFRPVQQSGKIYFSDPFLSLTSGQTSMTVAVPIFTNLQFQGVLVGELGLDLLQQQIIEQADLGERSISFIVDQRGTLLAHPNRDWVQERRHFGDAPLVQQGLAGNKTVDFFFDEDQQTWLIGSVTTMTPGWAVVTMQPFVAVAQPIIQVLVVASVALGLSLVVFFVIQRRSLRQITNPISVLAQKADALAGGEYEELSSRQMGECREIVSLGYSFVRMVEAVQERDQTVAKQLEKLKHAQEEIRRAQMFLDAIVENIPHTILVKETNSRAYVLSNKASEALFGFPREEMLGRTAYDFFPTEQADRFTAQDQAALDGRKLVEIPEEVVYTRYQGPRILDTKKLPILEKDGSPQFLLGISEDITERKQAEQALRDSEEKNRALSEATYEALFFSDQGICIEANQVASEMFGYSYEELIGILGTDVIAPESKEIVKHNMLSGYEEPYEAIAQRKDGSTFPAEFEGRMYEYKGKKVRVTAARDITERKQAEEALRESEEKYRQLFEMESDAIFLIDNATGQIMEANVAATKLYGYSREELLNKRNIDLSAEIEKTHQATKGERLLIPIRWHRRHDGSIFPVEITATHFDWRGRKIHIAAIRNITERIRAEEALRESEERHRSIVQNLTDIVWLVDETTRIKYVTPSGLNLLGYSEKELLGKTGFDLVCPEDMPIVEQVFAEVLRDENPYQPTEFRLRHADGHWIHVETVGKNMLDHPVIQSIVLTTRDVTERKRAKAALSESEARFRELAENIREVFWLFDWTKQKVIYVSPAFETIWGRSCQDLYERYEEWGESIHPDDLAYAAESFLQIIETGGGEAREYRIIRPDGTVRWISDRGFPIIDKDGQVVRIAGIAEEITDRKQAEEEIRKLNEELEQRVTERTAQLEAANKELESFAYSVSHDLRAPLRSIDGFSQMLLEDYGDKLEEDGQDYLDRVRTASQRMGQLIDDLLKLSRLTRSEMYRESAELSVMAEEIAVELQRSQPDRQAEFVIAPDVVATGDTRLLRVVLENLLGNAWKFTGKEAQAKIEFGCVRDNGNHAFYVRDNGAGFDMAYADKLFGAFQRLHKITEFEGTGIGLATVQRIIHRHGGRVWAEGEVGAGATFYFTLGG